MIAFVVAAALASDADALASKYVERGLSQRKISIGCMEADLREVLKRPAANRQEAADRKEEVDRRKKAIAEVKAGKVCPIPVMTWGTMQTGDVGELRDDDTLAGKFTFGSGTVKVLQVLGADVFLGTKGKEVVRIEGLRTSNLETDLYVNLAGHVYVVHGETQYQTILGGTRKALVLKTFDHDDEVESLWKRMHQDGTLVKGQPAKRIASKQGGAAKN